MSSELKQWLVKIPVTVTVQAASSRAEAVIKAQEQIIKGHCSFGEAKVLSEERIHIVCCARCHYEIVWPARQTDVKHCLKCGSKDLFFVDKEH